MTLWGTIHIQTTVSVFSETYVFTDFSLSVWILIYFSGSWFRLSCLGIVSLIGNLLWRPDVCKIWVVQRVSVFLIVITISWLHGSDNGAFKNNQSRSCCAALYSDSAPQGLTSQRQMLGCIPPIPTLEKKTFHQEDPGHLPFIKADSDTWSHFQSYLIL